MSARVTLTSLCQPMLPGTAMARLHPPASSLHPRGPATQAEPWTVEWGGAPAAPILHGDKLCPMPPSRDGTLDEGTMPACAQHWAMAWGWWKLQGGKGCLGRIS